MIVSVPTVEQVTDSTAGTEARARTAAYYVSRHGDVIGGVREDQFDSGPTGQNRGRHRAHVDRITACVVHPTVRRVPNDPWLRSVRSPPRPAEHLDK